MLRTGLSDGKTERSILSHILNLPSLAMILLISFYRRLLSPVLPRVCRFEPSCSSYGLQAFRSYPFPKALLLTLWRILRCNPFCKGGYDPLPQRRISG